MIVMMVMVMKVVMRKSTWKVLLLLIRAYRQEHSLKDLVISWLLYSFFVYPGC